MGRPLLLTPELVEQICASLASGNTLKDSALSVGIAEQTLSQWKTRANKEVKRLAEDPKAKPLRSEQIYLDFLEATSAAWTRATVFVVSSLFNDIRAGEVSAKDRMEFLARRDHEQWGNKQRTELTGASGGPVVIQGESMSDHDLIVLATRVSSMGNTLELEDAIGSQDDAVAVEVQEVQENQGDVS